MKHPGVANFASYVMELARLRGIDQQVLCAQAGVASSYLRQLKAGLFQPSLEKVVALLRGSGGDWRDVEIAIRPDTDPILLAIQRYQEQSVDTPDPAARLAWIEQQITDILADRPRVDSLEQQVAALHERMQRLEERS